MKLMSGLALAIAAALPLAAQDADPFKGMEVGQRVEVMFKAGHSLRGELVKPRGIDPYDLAKSSSIALNISLEYTRMDGQVSFEKQTIRSAKRLPALSPQQVSVMLSRKSREMARLNDEEKERIANQLKRFEEEKSKRVETLEEKIEGLNKGEKGEEDRAKKAAEVYAMFPEPEWNDKRYETLSVYLILSGREKPKYFDLRVPIPKDPAIPNSPQLFAPAKEDEAAFYDNHDLWVLGRELSKKTKDQPPAEEKKEEKKSEEKPKEEKPNPSASGPSPKDAFSQFEKSYIADDFNSLKNLSTGKIKSDAEAFLKGDVPEEARKMLADSKKAIPQNSTVEVESENESSATLKLSATHNGKPVTGKAELVKEDGAWKVKSWNWSTLGGQ